jgi:hypothetical protein
MNRQLYFKAIKAIREGKTFYRSGLPHTLANKLVWEELKLEIEQGYSIDVPRAA